MSDDTDDEGLNQADVEHPVQITPDTKEKLCSLLIYLSRLGSREVAAYQTLKEEVQALSVDHILSMRSFHQLYPTPDSQKSSLPASLKLTVRAYTPTILTLFNALEKPG